MSLRAYWGQLSERIDQSPAIRITRLTTIARTGRRTKTSVKRISVVLGLRVRVVCRLDLVVHLDQGAVAELEGARAHDLGALADAGQHRDLVAARRAELDELLREGLALRLLGVGEHEHGIAVRHEADRRGGQHEHRRALAG